MGDKASLEGGHPLQSQAEQQVARLEREVESLRARLKVNFTSGSFYTCSLNDSRGPIEKKAQNRSTTSIITGRGKSEELESKNFQLEEQVIFF